MVAVAHPDLLVTLGEPTFQNRQLVLRRHKGAPELCRAMARLNLAAQLMHHHLLAITDAQNRNAQIENLLRGTRRSLAGHTIRPPGKDHSFGRHLAHHFHGHILIWVDFTIDIQLAQTTGNQLRHLATKVDNKQAVVGCLCHGGRICQNPKNRKPLSSCRKYSGVSALGREGQSP